MVLIFGMAAAAMAAIRAFNQLQRDNPGAAIALVRNVRQYTGVIGVLNDFVRLLVNALALIGQPGTQQGPPLRIGVPAGQVA